MLQNKTIVTIAFVLSVVVIGLPGIKHYDNYGIKRVI